ncbi:MAG: aminopeptidase [Actinobacteria bacterium]|nr:aminopeptidase [Actinomycetota bacterium]
MPEATAPDRTQLIRALADLTVRFGANVQPGQIVAIQSEPGKEYLAREIAEQAYARGAKFVDLMCFDPYMKHARALHADPDSLDFVPAWLGEWEVALGRERAARVSLRGPIAPRLMEDVDPALAGRDMLPRVPEFGQVVRERTTAWTMVPCPTPGWAAMVHPDLEPDAALDLLWEDVEYVCRLDAPDPVRAWEERFAELGEIVAKINALDLDQVRYEGPGTDLTIGMLPSSRWALGEFTTVEGVSHASNLPTEEVYTSPDPDRVEGVVRATMPLFNAGMVFTGIEVTFDRGHAVRIEADDGRGETLRALTSLDEGARRLGELALVGGEARVGHRDAIFYDTLLDENASSHVAFGHGFPSVVGVEDVGRVNSSATHIDFMIGGEEVDATGITRGGREVPLLREGSWQV